MHNIGYVAGRLHVFVIPLENAIIISGFGTIGRMGGILALVAGIVTMIVQDMGTHACAGLS